MLQSLIFKHGHSPMTKHGRWLRELIQGDGRKGKGKGGESVR